MNIKTPLTRELFEAGERFLFYDDSVTGSVVFRPDKELGISAGSLHSTESQPDWKSYRCNVGKIDKTGFRVFGRHLGKWFDFKVKFNTCMHFPIQEKPERPTTSPTSPNTQTP